MKRPLSLSNRLRAGVTVALFAALWTAGPTATDAFGQRGSRGSSAGASRGSSSSSSRSGSFGSSSRGSSSRGSSSRGSSFGSRGSSFGSGSFRTRPTSIPTRPTITTRPTTLGSRPTTSGVTTQRPATVTLDGARRGETIGSGSAVPFGSSPAGGVEVGRSPSVGTRPTSGVSGFSGGALPSPADSLSPGRRVYVRVPSSYRAGGSTLAPATDSRSVRFQPESVRLRGYLSTEDPRGLRPTDSQTDRTLGDLVDRYGREPRLEPTPLDDERVAALERIATRRGSDADRVARERYGRGPLDRLARPNAPVVRPSAGAAPQGTLAEGEDGLTAGPAGNGRPSNFDRTGQTLTPGAGPILGTGNPGVSPPSENLPDGTGPGGTDNFGGQGGNSDTKSFFFGYGNGYGTGFGLGNGFGSSYGLCSPYWNSWGSPFGCSFGFGLSAWWYGSLWNFGLPYGYGYGNLGFNYGLPYYGSYASPFLFGSGYGFGGGVVQPAQPAQQVVIVEQAPAQVISAPTPAPTQEEEEKVFFDDGQGDAIPHAFDADLSQSPATAEIGLASERYLTLGDRAFRDERWADAVHYYTKATDLEPEVGVLYLVLSDALFAAGDYGFAAFAIRRAFSLDPALVDSTSDKRAFYASPANFDQQLAVLERYVADHPTSADARLVLSLNQLFGGSAEMALATLESDLTGSLSDDRTADLLRATATSRIALEAR